MSESPIVRAASAARPAVRAAGALLAADAPWPPARRLVVLVPATLTDETRLAARLYPAAQARRLNVLFLGLVAQPAAEPALRRRLALLAACTRDNHAVHADYRLAVGEDWLGWLRQTWQPGDLVLCHAEQTLGWGRAARSLAHVLAEQVGLTVVVLSGFCVPAPDPAAASLRQVCFWLGAVLVVAAGFVVQAGIQQHVAGLAQSGLLILSVIVEFGLLAAWSRRLES
jgi:hypothetical protein